MSVRSAQAVTVTFFTETAADADSTPTGTLVLNGTDDGATVTVTHVSTGRYTAAVTLPTLAIGDIVEIVVSATVATVAEKFVIWRDMADIAVSAAGGVTLADGVAHGGTPGSGTATLALQAVKLSNPSGHAAWLESTGGNGIGLVLKGHGFNSGLAVEGGSDDGYGMEVHGGGNSPALVCTANDSTAVVVSVGDSTGGGHAVKVEAAGAGHKAILLSGDAATDAFAIAAGAGSPIDVFNADGSVDAALVATGLDAIDVTAPTGPATTFREMVVQTWRRLFKGSAKNVSGHTVKTYADDGTTVVTTQSWTDDGSGNETMGGAT